MLAIVWECAIASLSFLGASYVWLFAAPAPPSYDRLAITLSSLLFAACGLFFSYRVCRAGRRFCLWLIIGVLMTQSLVVYHILSTPFFKI